MNAGEVFPCAMEAQGVKMLSHPTINTRMLHRLTVTLLRPPGKTWPKLIRIRIYDATYNCRHQGPFMQSACNITYMLPEHSAMCPSRKKESKPTCLNVFQRCLPRHISLIWVAIQHALTINEYHYKTISLIHTPTQTWTPECTLKCDQHAQFYVYRTATVNTQYTAVQYNIPGASTF